jgi:hypothetical protein
MDNGFTPQPTMEAILRALETVSGIERGIILIAARQTADERSEFTTKYDNDKGFEAWAARKGTRIANWVANGGTLADPPRGFTDWPAFTKKVLTRNRWQLLEEAWKKWWKANAKNIHEGMGLVIKYGFTLSDGTKVRHGAMFLLLGITDPRPGFPEGCIRFLYKDVVHEETPSYVFRRMQEVMG